MAEENRHQSNATWRILFGEEFDKDEDKKGPAFEPYRKAMESKKRAAVETWVSDGGDMLLEDMLKAVKQKMLACVSINRLNDQGREASLLLLDEIKRDILFVLTIENTINPVEDTLPKQ